MSFKNILKRQNLFFYIIIVLVSIYISSYLLEYAINLLDISSSIPERKGPLANIHNKAVGFIVVCIAAPLVETFLTQKVPIEYLKDYLKPIQLVLVSAAIFSLIHWYSIAYMIHTFIIGVVLAAGYVLWNRPQILSSFWVIVIVHSCKNLISFFLLNFY